MSFRAPFPLNDFLFHELVRAAGVHGWLWSHGIPFTRYTVFHDSLLIARRAYHTWQAQKYMFCLPKGKSKSLKLRRIFSVGGCHKGWIRKMSLIFHPKKKLHTLIYILWPAFIYQKKRPQKVDPSIYFTYQKQTSLGFLAPSDAQDRIVLLHGSLASPINQAY